jgi:hypothetical protein
VDVVMDVIAGFAEDEVRERDKWKYILSYIEKRKKILE